MKKISMLDRGINGIKWMSLSAVSTTIVNFILTIVLARLLNANDYGEFQAIAVLVGFADILWSIGIGPALIRKKELTTEDINTGHTINVLMGIIIFLVINIWGSFWCKLFVINNQQMLHVYSFIFIINTFLAVPKSLLYRNYKYKIVAIASIIGVIVHAVLGVLLAYGGWGAWALIISTLIQYLVQIFFIIPNLKIKYKFSICKKSIDELAYFGGGYTLMQIFNYIALQGDNFIVNKFLGSEALGYYGKAYNLMGYPANLVGQTLDQVMYPILSEAQDNKEKLKRIFLAETCLIGIVVAPITAVGVVCRKELVSFLLGDRWLLVTVPMMIMILTLFFRTAYKLNYTVLKALGKVYIMSLIQFIYAVSIILCCYIGHFWGLKGVAVGACVAIIVNYLGSLRRLIIEIQIEVKLLILSYIAPLIYQVSLIFIAYIIHNRISKYFFGNLIILVTVTLIVFGIYSIEYKLSYKYIVLPQTNKYIEKIYLGIRDKVKKLRILKMDKV